jgi:hypothetical protein
MRRVRAAIGLTVAIGAFWTLALILLRFSVGFLLDGTPVSDMLFWLRKAVLPLSVAGLFLGASYAAGVVAVGAGVNRTTLSRGRSSLIGMLGGAVVFICTFRILGRPTSGPLMSVLLLPLVPFVVAGAITGLGVWRVTNRRELRSGGDSVPLSAP